MKILKKIGLFLAIFIAIGFFMPGTTRIERSIAINAPATSIFTQINEFKNWGNWSPWHKMDPNMTLKFSEPSASVGANYTWASQKMGNGKVTLLDEKVNEKAHFKLEFEGQGESSVDFNLLAKDSTATNVSWIMTTDNGLNPIKRWFGLVMEKMMAPDFEKGLADMKSFCEMKK
jgi:Polyketide cyclase / dehydrase and lipid transport